MRDAVIAEKQNTPTIAVVTQVFEKHGKTIAKVEGHPDMQFLSLPFPLEGLPETQLRDVAERFYPQLLSLLGVTE